MKTLVKHDQVLAILIFVLWSFGLLFAPYAQSVFASATTFITTLYLLLHLVVFLYTLYLCGQLMRSVRTKRMRFSLWAGRAALYGYVLLALLYSASLLLKLV
jgi:fumarate reductase subunit D